MAELPAWARSPASEQALVAQMVGFRDVEQEMDGIGADDGGEQGGRPLAALDQVAGIDLAVGDAAAERRGDVGPFEVELGDCAGLLRRP